MKKTILIVDDIDVNLKLLELILKDKYNVLSATNGSDAIELVKNNHIDLILLDIIMPNMTGYEVCEVLQQDIQTKHIPVIFITSQIDEDSIIKGYEVGGVDYVTKPYKAMELLAKIKTHLKLKSLIEELEYVATHDTMTEIYNRREFFRLAKEKFKTTKNDLYIVMIDIDNFKDINDTYGHDMGDKVIKEFAGLVKKHIKKDSVFGRIGGEEFALVCEFSNYEDLKLQLENIRQSIENNCIIDGDKYIKFTISIGLAKKCDKHNNIDEVLKEADKNLYQAKKDGKNKIVFRRR